MIPGEPNALCFAAAPYANSTPLWYYLPKVSAGARLLHAPPSQTRIWLNDGTADMALVPVADFLANPGLAMVDGVGVCAREQVQSVLIKCLRPLHQVRGVRKDAASITSNALAEILLRRHFRLDLRMLPPAARRDVDAEVMIGDRAMLAPPAECGDIDMAGAWRAMTGLPFVFAVWAHRIGHPQAQELRRVAQAAMNEGVTNLDYLAAVDAKRLGLTLERCLDYFHTAIHYEVGPAELEAMRLFGTLMREMGAAPAVADAMARGAQ
jgi:predicted solute-binding protein